MAYIEREKAIAEINKGDLLVGNNAEWANEILNRIPTADVVEVVRCKDCRYWEEIGIDPITDYTCGYCRHYQWQDEENSRETDGQDFCSYGERERASR